MAGKDWNDLGQDINRIIQDAVDKSDFSRLNDSIQGILSQTFCGSQKRNSGSGWEFDLSGSKSEYSQTGSRSQQKQTSGGSGNAAQSRQEAGSSGSRVKQTEAPEGGNGASQQTAAGAGNGSRPQREQGHAYREPVTYGNTAGGYNKKWKKAPYFAGNGKKYGASAGLLSGGISLMVVSCVPLVMLIVKAFMGRSSGMAMFISFMVCLAAGIVMTAAGGHRFRMAGRFNRYIRILNGRHYADIKILAEYSQTTEKDVLKDIKKMIRKGWFTQGHLDENETCLMVSNEAYRQYLNTVKNMQIQQQEREARARAEKARKDRLTPEAAAMLDRGREYIVRIRKSNDAIPGEEISAKIKRIEILVARILQQAEAHPETIGDLRRLMDYYLPTTVKLLDAYEELDSQPVQGDNIASSKKEIENTLDTLNQAFEKLLDDMFRDRAWDVSADISVLETMLAQEGLTENDFGKINV